MMSSLFSRFGAAVTSFFAATSTTVTTTSDVGWTELGSAMQPDKAMSLSAFFACIQAISQDIGKLPAKAYRNLPNGGKQALTGHPVHRLVHDEPNPEAGPMVFQMVLQAHALGWGDGYAEISRSFDGVPRRMDIVEPWRVTPERTRDGIRYKVHMDSGESRFLPSRNMLHIRGMGDSLRGWSVAKIGAQSLSLGLERQAFSERYHKNNLQAGMVATAKTRLDDPGTQRLIEQMEKRVGGQNQFKMLILPNSIAEVKQATISAEDAQLLESMEFSVVDVARWFRVPPHIIQHLANATFTNIEHQGQEYGSMTLLPWITIWEQEYRRKLFTEAERAEGFFVQHNMDAVLRADTSTRAEFHRTMVNIGARSPDEVRQLEDENPIGTPAAQAYYMQSNMATLDNVHAGTATNAGRMGATEQPEKPPTSAAITAERLRPVFAHAADRLAILESRHWESAMKKPKSEREGYQQSFYQRFADNMADAMSAGASLVGPEGIDTVRAYAADYAANRHQLTAAIITDEIIERLSDV